MNHQINIFFKNNIDSIIIGIIGFCVVQLFTNHAGLGISPDSIHYISASDALIAHKGYIQFDGNPLIMFPFGYPTFLYLIQIILGNNLLNSMPHVNGVLFAILIILSGFMMEASRMNRWIKWLLLGLIVTSPTLIEIYYMLWSESLFAIEVLIFIYLGRNYFNNYTLKSLIVFSFITAIAFDTRLAGFSMVVTGALFIFLNKEINWNKKWIHAVLYVMISCSLLLLNLFINYYKSNSLTGKRQKGITTFLENLQNFGNVIVTWLPLQSIIKNGAIYIAVLFILVILFLFLYRTIKQIEHNSFEKIAASFTLIYTLFMLISATFSRYETLNSRLLSPFYIPFILTISFYISSVSKNSHYKSLNKYTNLIFIILILLTIQNQIIQDIKDCKSLNEGGIGGYTEDDWKESELINYLQTNAAIWKNSKPIYSNASHAIYLYTKKSVAIVPERVHIDNVKIFNKVPESILIWFNTENNKDVLSLSEINQSCQLILVKKFKDGAIYLRTFKK